MENSSNKGGSKTSRGIYQSMLSGVPDRHRIQVILHYYLYQKRNAIFRRRTATDYVVAYIKPEIVSEVIESAREAKRFDEIDSNRFVSTEFFETKEDAVTLLRENPHSSIEWRYAPKLQLMY